MTNLPRIILALEGSAFITGCLGTRTEYFTDTTYPSRSTADPVEWLIAEPARPHLEVARITVRSSNYGMETLRQTMLDRARALGADAIVPGVPMVVKPQTGSPYYVMSPAYWDQQERRLVCMDTDGTRHIALTPIS